MIKADQAHRIDEGSTQVLVGVLDSGIDPDQPNLTSALDPSASAGCVTGAPDTQGSAWEPTTSSHGTHVAGTIAAADDGKGVTGRGAGRAGGVGEGGRRRRLHLPGGSGLRVHVGRAERHDDRQQQLLRRPVGVHLRRTPPASTSSTRPWSGPSTYATRHGVLSIAAAGNAGVDLTDPGQDSRSPDNVDSGDQEQRQLGDDCAQLPAGIPGVVTVSAVGADEAQGQLQLVRPRRGRRDGPRRRPAAAAPRTVDVRAVHRAGRLREFVRHVDGGAARGRCGRAAGVDPSGRDAEAADPTAGLHRPTRSPCPADYDLNGTGAQDAYCTGDSTFNSFYGHGMVDALAAVAYRRPPRRRRHVGAADASRANPPAQPTRLGRPERDDRPDTEHVDRTDPDHDAEDDPVPAPQSAPATQATAAHAGRAVRSADSPCSACGERPAE